MNQFSTARPPLPLELSTHRDQEQSVSRQSPALVRETAADAARVIDTLPAFKKEVLRGREDFYLDGNHLASMEHRPAELRGTLEGPLPGQSLAVLDAQRESIVEWVPWKDGHAQERALLPELLERMRARSVIVADRNFCPSMFLFGLAAREAFFVIRQHGSTLTRTLRGRNRRVGRIATGLVYEQATELHFEGATRVVRRITLCLDHPTESGYTEIFIITNLSPERATTLQVSQAHGTRRTVEGASQTLTDVLRCEVETLGYPRAALFSFAVAVLAYDTYAVVQASLRAAHGADAIKDKLSDYHLMSDVAETYVGMGIAVPDECWETYRAMPVSRFANAMTELAHRVKLARYPKKKRRPKKPQLRRKSGRRNHHISTALEATQEKTLKGVAATPRR